MTGTEPLAPLPPRTALRRLLERLNAPCDGAGLGAFRVLLGALLCLSVGRFWAYGWIEQLYLEPSFHFTYLGFDWVRPWPAWGMHALFALMAVAALALCAGVCSRASALIFCLTFTYAELIEKASYLNHYYFVSLVTLLLSVMPSGASFSVDAWWRRRRARPPEVVRLWSYALLRAQVGVLFFFAGFAKLNPDWLLEAEPLGMWLAQHADAPLIGALLATKAAAFVASYAGAAYDLTIVVWLSWRRTRAYAYAVAVVFHVAVWLLFPIGVFSWVMLVATTSFFDPRWPWRYSRQRPELDAARAALPSVALQQNRLGPARLGLIGGYLALQVAVPLRFLMYPGNVNWHEQGFRFSWRVMLIEKTGQVEFTVLVGDEDRRYVVYPRERLTPLQYKMMSTQPDMIQEYAQHLARTFSAEGQTRVRVYADAWASLNGRPRRRLIDPDVDLAGAPRTLRASSWILPL